jgi:signal transduction histidine kinase
VKLDAEFYGRLADQTETHLFRIAQEALTNVARHSGAQHVCVRLVAEGQRILLSIEDDGRGLSQAAGPRRGLGLSGMLARARSAGGDLEIRPALGHGVRIEVRVPMSNETHSHTTG